MSMKCKVALRWALQVTLKLPVLRQRKQTPHHRLHVQASLKTHKLFARLKKSGEMTFALVAAVKSTSIVTDDSLSVHDFFNDGKF